MLSDEEVRAMTIGILAAETERDEQSTIGASNLSNQCDFCLASNLLGDDRTSPAADAAWGGRVLGTAAHGLVEKRLKEAVHMKEEARAAFLRDFGMRHPDAQVEQHTTLGVIPGYGEVGTTPDLFLPGECQVFDWKGTEKKKIMLLLDALGKTHYGREHKWLQVYEPAPTEKQPNRYRKVIEQVSERIYDHEMRKAMYKATGYYNQIQSYCRAKSIEGYDVRRGSIVFISRDDTMVNDNPASAEYENWGRTHGINVISFDYVPEHAEAVWQRGLDIWAHLQSGGTPADFTRHEMCWTCSMEDEKIAREERQADVVATIAPPAAA